MLLRILCRAGSRMLHLLTGLQEWTCVSRASLLAALLLARVGSCVASPDVTDFWASYDARKEPLDVEVVREWESDAGRFQLVRYRLGRLTGSNKSAAPIIAAYYGCPRDAAGVPGIVHIHGGGQRAHAGRVQSWVELGYACISINWGAKVLEEPDTPNTDWDGLAAGFIRPGVAKTDGLDHHNLVRPDRNTLYKEAHLLNSSWALIAVSARRALTFLERRPEVDGNSLGVEGHSMGGRSTVLTAIDPRIKAVSPSVGGSGFLYGDLWGLSGSARHMRVEDGLALYRKVVSAQAYWPHIKAPVLFLGASNDFNSPTELVVRGMSLLPRQTPRMLVLAPHLNHRFTTATAAARFMWMEAHLKDNFAFPKPPDSRLDLDSPDGVPVFSVSVDGSSGLPIEKVEIFYGYARDPRIRFWRSADAQRDGSVCSGRCPVFDVNEPLFAFANITYTMNRTLPARPGHRPSNRLTVSSEYRAAHPEDLKAAAVEATEIPRRRVDDFSNGWQDWYRLNADNREHWFYATRKLLDPSWVGPKGGKLVFDVETSQPGNCLAVGVRINDWQGYTGRKKDSYHALVPLSASGRNAVALSSGDFKNDAGEALKDWDEITELFLTPSNRIRGDLATDLKWQGIPPRLVDLRWEGGRYLNRPHPHQPRGETGSTGRAAFEEELRAAIDDSVELERKGSKSE
jgi:dienelactone hydrolase